MTIIAETARTFKSAHGPSSSNFVGRRPPSTMGAGSLKHHPRDAGLELNNQFSDTASSASSTCSDPSIPSCASTSLCSGFTTSCKTGSDSESASSTPRTTPSRVISCQGKPGQANSTAKVLKNSNPVKDPHRNVSTFELQEDPEFWNDHNVQVLVRIRPVSSSEASGHCFSRCVRQDGPHTITWLGQPQTRFSFDHVAGESITQEDLFRVAGAPMVENCMRGFNSCMFAYGQTGSGKTYTMLGDIHDLGYRPSPQRGMAPRVFEYLFSRIQQEEKLRELEQLRFSCKCSFLEIHNEHITDLLNPTSTNLQIREDVKTGVYVENLKQIEVKTVHDVVQLLIQGASHRKVAATNMNSESSRSHSVFSCTVESRWQSDSLSKVRVGRLNLVDLAGSERQSSSGAEGDRLKEAATINKSLSTLGLVIMTLVDIAHGKQRHVPYRDSKLTFLLQDSLGGNSKTTIIATISPANGTALETMSTLKFAQRAKLIKNNAHINEDSSGDVNALRREIQQLKEELKHLKCQNVSAILPLENDHPRVASSSPTPGIGSNNLLHKIRTVEATLSAALRREHQAQLEAKRYATIIDQLHTLMQQRDQNTQNGRLILRLRDEKIRRLEAVVGGQLPVDNYLIEENKRLVQELELVRAQVERNPELTRSATDKILLLEQVRGFQVFYEQGERESMLADIANLRDQLLETTRTKLALEQGALALSSAQANKYRKELEICCNDLSTCLEINSTLTRQVEQLTSQVAQLSARCQEQQQDLDFLKTQPMGCLEELELERSVHLQIIEDLKAQVHLQQKEREESKRNAPEDDIKNVVQDKHTVNHVQAEDQTQVQRKIVVNPEPEPYVEDFATVLDSLFDEDIEQLSVFDVKQAAMETEFETFSELMRAKESLLDEDLEKIDVCTKRQSLETEFEAYSGILDKNKSCFSEKLIDHDISAETLEMASRTELFTELMEGEEKLLRDSLEQLNINADVVSLPEIDKPSRLEFLVNGVHQDLVLIPKPETMFPTNPQTNKDPRKVAHMVADSEELVSTTISEAKPGSEVSKSLSEMLRVCPKDSKPVPDLEFPSIAISKDISHRQVALNAVFVTEETLVLAESHELDLPRVDILQVGTTATVDNLNKIG